MPHQASRKTDTIQWLLEEDSPGVRYLALRDLAGEKSPELARARKAAHERGPIAAHLRHMNQAGFWVHAGAGYNPKYRSGVWSLLALAEMGASIDEDQRIAVACEYMLEHALCPGGQFTMTESPAGTIDCLQGNLCWALLELGCDPVRLEAAFDWMARTVTDEGLAPARDRSAELRYFAYKVGPEFACGANGRLACAWGAVKVMLAFSRLPRQLRTPRIERAIQRGVEFIFSVDPATASYPTRTGDKPSRNWWKFGFPVFYVTDLIQLVQALVDLGYGHDRRLANALAVIREKQDSAGRWALDYDYIGKTWATFGPKRKPNKWVTLRALRALKSADGA